MRYILVCTLLLTTLSACERNDLFTLAKAGAAIPVTSVAIIPDSVTLPIGGTQQLTATITPVNATERTVTWASQDTGIAQVNSTGLVTGISPGTVIIIVTTQDGSLTAQCQVTVEADSTPPVPGNNGTILPSNITSGSIDLQWTAATDNITLQADLEYAVYRSDTGNIGTAAECEANGTIIVPFTADITGTIATGLNPSTGYYFNTMVRDQSGNRAAYVMISQSTSPAPSIPALTTDSIRDNMAYTISIAGTSARCGGVVVADGGAEVTERGLCWNTTGNPTTADSHVTAGSGTGNFNGVVISALSPDTVYHVRAYATNSAGAGYGNEIIFNSGKSYGASFAGGLVFYNDGYGGGLVSSTRGVPSEVINRWSNMTSTAVGTTLTGIGTGRQNTLAIISQSGHTDSAAKISRVYNNNIYYDWYLPSMDELNLMYINLHLNGLGGFDAGTGQFYWSSSEYSGTTAYYQFFQNGTISNAAKAASTNYRVRPIRSFGYNDVHNLQLRDTGPGGGIIFYINPDSEAIEYGWKYLEASPLANDLAGIAWGGQGIVTGADGTVMASGLYNTVIAAEILAANSITDGAAQQCMNLSIGGYNDWFLPSLRELEYMYTNLHSGTDQNATSYTPVGGFSSVFYWSSSENDLDGVHGINFGVSVASTVDDKSVGHNTRAARRF